MSFSSFIHRRFPWLGLLCVAGLLAGATVPAGAASAAGSGGPVKRIVEPGEFSALELRTQAPVEIRLGEVDQVEITGDDNLDDALELRLKDRSLSIRDTGDYRSSVVKIVVTLRQLQSLSAGGSTAVSLDGLKTRVLALQLGGSSAARLLNLQVHALSVTSAGSSSLRLSGSADLMALDLGGSADVDAAQLEARSIVASTGGSASAQVWARTQLTASAGGSSMLRYRGTPSTTVSVGKSARVAAIAGAASP